MVGPFLLEETMGNFFAIVFIIGFGAFFLTAVLGLATTQPNPWRYLWRKRFPPTPENLRDKSCSLARVIADLFAEDPDGWDTDGRYHCWHTGAQILLWVANGEDHVHVAQLAFYHDGSVNRGGKGAAIDEALTSDDYPNVTSSQRYVWQAYQRWVDCKTAIPGANAHIGRVLAAIADAKTRRQEAENAKDAGNTDSA
jgi:hypothetical protein